MYSLYPLRFKPILKEKIWGGRQLKKYCEKDFPENKKIGESWELSDRPDNESIIINGNLAGKTIHDIVQLWNKALYGKSASDIPERFPLLIKYLDINDVLSVQVHPDDDYIKKHQIEDSGKTEFWYIWKTLPGSTIKCGFTQPLNPELVRKHLKEKNINNYLKTYNTLPGEGYLIDAGIVHAPCRGNLIIEIQENSDITYRLYDWDRPGLDGKPRELHVNNALEVINWDKNLLDLRMNPAPDTTEKAVVKDFTQTKYFSIKEINFNGTLILPSNYNTFSTVIVTQGNGEIIWNKTSGEKLKTGDLYLIPALLDNVSLKADHSMRILLIN